MPVLKQNIKRCGITVRKRVSGGVAGIVRRQCGMAQYRSADVAYCCSWALYGLHTFRQVSSLQPKRSRQENKKYIYVSTRSLWIRCIENRQAVSNLVRTLLTRVVNFLFPFRAYFR